MRWANHIPLNQFIRLVCFTILFSILSACAGIPKQELSTYVSAYNQTRLAAEQVLTDLVASQEKIKTYHKEEDARNSQPTKNRAEYVPPNKRGTGAGPDAIAVRLAALALVSQYNDLLVAIAEGKRVEILQANLQVSANTAMHLLSLAGTTIPGADALTGLLRTAAAAAQKYVDRQAFVKVIGEGAPLVKQILQFLIDETPLIVQVHEGIWDAESAPLRGKVSRIVRSMLAQARKYKSPPSKSIKKKRATKIESRLAGLISLIEPREVKLTFGGTTSVPPEMLTQLETNLSQVEVAVRVFLENRKKSPTLRALMDEYVNALSTTQMALDNVSLALKQPVDFAQVTTDLLETAISLKQQFAIYKAAINSP